MCVRPMATGLPSVLMLLLSNLLFVRRIDFDFGHNFFSGTKVRRKVTAAHDPVSGSTAAADLSSNYGKIEARQGPGEGQRERERGPRRSAGSTLCIGPHTVLLLYFKYLTSQEH